SYAPDPAAAQGRELLLDARSCALCFSFVDHRFHQAFAFTADPKPRSRSASLGQTLPGHHLYDFLLPDQEASVTAVNDAVDHRLLPHATTPLMIYAAGSTQAKPCFLMSPSRPWPMPVIRRRSSRLVKGLFWMISSARAGPMWTICTSSSNVARLMSIWPGAQPSSHAAASRIGDPWGMRSEVISKLLPSVVTRMVPCRSVP